MDSSRKGNSKKNEISKKSSKKKMEVTALDKAQINELLSESLQNYVVKAKKEAKDFEQVISLINDQVSEFLENFLLLGYDLRGNPICIHHAKNQMESDALNTLLNKIIINSKME